MVFPGLLHIEGIGGEEEGEEKTKQNQFQYKNITCESQM
jgi:hypothetical protein